MKLLYYELKKMLGLRLLWTLLVLCLIANGVLAYSFTEKNEAYPHLKRVEAAYLEDPDGLYRYYEQLTVQSNEHRLLMEAYFRGELAEEPTLERPCTFSGDAALDDELLIRMFYRKANSERFFKTDLEHVIRHAKAQQAETLFSNALFGEDGFAYQEQGLIAQTYTNIYLNAEIQPEIAYGWDQLFAFDTVNLFLLLLVMAGTVAVLCSDVGSTALILRSAPNGRRRTAAAKLAVLLLFSLLSTLLLLFSTYLGVWLKCGTLSSLSNSIAVFSDYGMTPYCVTVGEYLGLFLLSKLLLSLAVGALCSLFCTLTRRIALGCSATLFAVAVGLPLYHLHEASAMRFLSFYGLSRFFELTSTFRCVDLFGYAVLLLPVVLSLIAAVSLLGGIAFWLCYRPPSVGIPSIFSLRYLRRFFSKISARHNGKGTPPLSLYWYELRKSLLSRKGLLLLAALLLLKLGTASSTYAPRENYQAMLYAEYMQAWSGPTSAETQQAIREEYEGVQAALNDFDRMRYAFLRGELEESVFSDYMTEYNYAADRVTLIEQIHDHAAYLDTLPAKGIENGYFLYDLDWNVLFSAGADLLLILYTVLAFSGVFADEYGKAELLTLLRTAKNGRERLFWSKILFTLATTGGIALLTAGIDAVWIITHLSLPNAEAPLLSLERFGNISTTIGIGSFLALGTLVRIFAVMLVGLLSALLGVWIRQRIYTALIALSIVFAPRIAADLGASPLRLLDLAGACSLSELLLRGGTWSYVWLFFLTCTLLAAVLIGLARKELCK